MLRRCGDGAMEGEITHAGSQEDFDGGEETAGGPGSETGKRCSRTVSGICDCVTDNVSEAC